MALAARIAYALLFCALVPLLLVAWARAADPVIDLPVYGPPLVAIATTIAGAILLAAGMFALWRKGGGLPMNAFPPPRLVTSGLFAWLPHPIYTGFSLVCFGAAMLARSAAGLWLVAPTATLSCVALVYGYERPDLVRRFGSEALKSIRCLPPPASARPAFADCLGFFLYVALPWLAIYEAIAVLGVQRGSIDTRLPFEARLPVWTWTEPIYASVYLIALLSPFLTPTRRDLRLLMIRSWLAMATVFPLYLFLPTHSPFRPFEGGGLAGALLALERSLDMPGEALPSFHVIWAILAACAIGSRLAAIWAAAVAFSCVANGMHAIADVLAGGLWGLFLLRADRVWEALRRATERIANSWREWRIGPFRLISHAFYGGLSTFVCVAMVAAVVDSLSVVALTSIAGLAGAAMWARWIEGSPRLLRPFGFYGGLFGVMAAASFTPHPWLVMAAYSVAAPWLQSIGRLRCLVQGCCHGAPADPRVGICYRHPRSRVCRLSNLAGVPVHATPLYSILSNLATALVLARLWRVAAPLTVIGGVYLLLNGLARFVEEAYRGEPQTPIFAGLRLYQWIATLCVVAGAAITTIPSGSAPPAHWSWPGIAIAAALAVISALALGFDAPASDRPFARLT